MTPERIHEIVAAQRAFFRTGATLDVDWRIAQLKKLKEAIGFYQDEILAALHEDLGRTDMEGYFCDVGTVLLELNETLHGIRSWAKPESHFSGLLCFPSARTKVHKMPYGVSLIISPFNFPFLLSLGALIPAIAGGNTAVMKASSKSRACTAVLQKLIARAFPENYVTVIDGGHDVADMCLAARFDKIFYTGSPKVGVHVMTEAAKNLTPVALELGGETGNWCVVRKDANLRDAARKIAFFKLLNSGQICININQVAVAEEVADEFLKLLRAEYERQIGIDPLHNPEYPKLIGRKAYDCAAADAEAYRDRIVMGGWGDPETLRFEPTVIYPVKIDEEIVRRELFSPILPVVPFPDAEADKLMETIGSREHGLSLYVFTKNRKWAEKVMAKQQFGGGCINEVVLHLMVRGVPFNGTGHSGMGAYHGEWGFREFTHPKTVLYGSTRFNLPLREHPYTGRIADVKLKILKLMER
ncbi:MAG: aldehyde dehydrogenase family protein [Oscillospiraceae bacterium]|nr:aldehyde dehydrogenase family protein [Oscillospiraceae bacterium]